MALTAPSAEEVLDFQFKLHCRLKVFDNEDSAVFAKPCSLVTAASRYGLIFVGSSNASFQVISLENIEQISEKKADVNDYLRRTITLPSRPSHLSVNCDCTLLCVVVVKESCATALIYNVASFATQNVAVVKEIRLSATPGVFVIELSWNPTIPAVLTVCKSDQSLTLYEFKGASIEINEIPPSSGATCMCWSPKGKQLAVGGTDGKITQYKPDLKAVKSINAPQLEGGRTVLALQWVSNYQFIAIYGSTDPESRANLVVVDAPKTGDTKYVNYEDICYSYGSTRPVQFYMILQPTWNVLMVASSNSMEVGILGQSKEQQWTQWILGDAARAELPLSPKKQDTLPIGLAVDTGTKHNISLGEQTSPPAPFLYLMSHYGVLCCFHIFNIREGAAQICQTPETLPENNGLKYFTKEGVVDTASKPQQPLPPITKEQTLPPPITKEQTLPPPISITKPLLVSPQQPQVATTTAKIWRPQTAPTPQPIKVELKPTVPLPPTTVESVPTVPKLDVETEKLISKMIKEECISLESELKALLHKAQSLNVSLGSDAESTELVKSTEDLQIFLEKITETSAGQAAEIHSLKQKLLQSWAWFEDARSRFAISKDPAMAVLIRTQPLDPASQQHLDDIKHLLYYIESQLTQANNTLDEQWEGFQDFCKKTYKLKMPTMETIYQAMVRQTATVQKQNYILKDIAARLRKHNSTGSYVALLASLESADDVVNKLKGLQLQPQDLIQVEYERVLKKQKQLNQEKLDKLQEFFVDHKPRIIRIVKPQVTTLKLTPQKSVLEANLSPVVSKATEAVPRALDFMQSTPKPTTTSKQWIPATELKPALFASAFASTTQPSKPAVTPMKTITTVPQSSNSLFSATTKSTFSFTPATTSAVDASKFSFTTIPTTANPIFSGFKFQTSSAPTTQVSLFGADVKTVVSSPAIIKPTAKAAVAPLTQFSVQPQDASKGASFLQSPQTSTVQGVSLFAKPAAAFGNKTSQAPLSVFSFSSTEVGASKTIATATSSSVSPVKTTTTTFGAQPSLQINSIFAATTTVQSNTTAPSIFGSSISNASIFTATTAKSPTVSIFGVATTAATSTPNIFGVTPVTVSTSAAVPQTTVTSGFVTGQTSTTTSDAPQITSTVSSISTTTSPTILAVPSPTTSVFAASPASTTTSTLGTVPTTSVVATNIFGAATATTGFTVTTSTPTATTSAGIFGAATTVAISTTPAMVTTAATFGTAPTGTATTGLFALAAATTTTGAASIFGVPTTTKSVFGTATPATTVSSIFGSAAVTTTASGFGTATTTTSGFGTAATTTSTFGSVTPASALSAAATITSGFGQTTTTSSGFGLATTTTGVFGSATTTSSGFGLATTTTGVFGSATTTSSGFGPASTTSSGFGLATTTTSVFGSATTTTPSIFGAAPTASSIFGTAPATTGGSIFGGAPAFGSTAFGQKAPSNTFGSAPVFATTAPAFGSVTTGQTTTFGSGSLFGTPASTSGTIFGGSGTQSSGNIFGKPATTTPAFGTPTTTTPAFGTPTTTTPAFGSASGFSFANAAANVPNANTAFGFNKPTGGFGGSDASSFSFGSLNVGTTTTTSFGSGFGQSQTANPFNRSDGSKPAFGSSSGSIFGSPTAPTSGSIFGAGSGTFGGSPTFGAAPAFGASSGFGSTFGTASQTSGGPFSGGGQSVGQTGFGGGAFQSSPGGFGGPPVFGSNSPGGFGAAPAFGSTPAFGSPGKNFGTPNIASSTFGSTAAQQNPTFGNLANQNTLGFGSLAQQTQAPPAQQPAFGSGSSFSSWR